MTCLRIGISEGVAGGLFEVVVVIAVIACLLSVGDEVVVVVLHCVIFGVMFSDCFCRLVL